MDFEITKEQYKKYKKWASAQHKKLVAERGMFYSGAVGGSETFSFTPTSIGMIVVVKNLATGEEINLTDYGSW